MASADPLVWLAVLALMVGAIGGSTPLWKSTRLSPDSIQRRTYWLCCVLVVVFGFASQLPNIPGALFVAGASALVLLASPSTGPTTSKSMAESTQPLRVTGAPTVHLPAIVGPPTNCSSG